MSMVSHFWNGLLDLYICVLQKGLTQLSSELFQLSLGPAGAHSQALNLFASID